MKEGKTMNVSNIIELFFDWFKENEFEYNYREDDFFPRIDYKIGLGTGNISYSHCSIYFIKKNDEVIVDKTIHLEVAPYEDQISETMKYVNLVNREHALNTHLTIDSAFGKMEIVSRTVMPSVEHITKQLIEDVLFYPPYWLQDIVGDGLLAVIQGFCNAEEGDEKSKSLIDTPRIPPDSNEESEESEGYYPDYGI